MTARKLEDYKIGERVQVAVAFGTKDVAWWPGKVTAIREHLEDTQVTRTVSIVADDGGMWTVNEKNAHIVRYPNDAIPIGTEVECRVDGRVGIRRDIEWLRGVVTSQVSDHVSYWVKHPDGHRHWPADRVRAYVPPVKSADDLAKELAAAKAEVERLSAVLERDCATYHADIAAVKDELAKVKEAHGDTTKAHFEASYNLGIARSERDDLAKELEREKENHLLLVKTFREVIDKLTKRTREQEEIIEAKRVEILNLCSHEKILTARAESAEKALAEQANIHGLRHEDIEQIEAMWKRKFEALEKKLQEMTVLRNNAIKAYDSAELKLSQVREALR